MAIIMTANDFIAIAQDIANDYKTLYVMGCFGAPMTQSNKIRYCDNCAYNRNPTRRQMIMAASSDTFGFDCVNLIKGILWGWSGDKNALYGGAKYASNGVPDVNADQIMGYCTSRSSDFRNIVPGEILHSPGHAGIYIGNGLAVECTPAWNNNVQFSAVGNIGSKPGYHSRTWKEHGRLPWISYSGVVPTPTPTPAGGTYMFEVKTIQKGSTGADVLLCQKILKADGYKNGNKQITLDGDFGSVTEKLVKQFQTDSGIKDDGICGPKTWNKLLGV